MKLFMSPSHIPAPKWEAAYSMRAFGCQKYLYCRQTLSPSTYKLMYSVLYHMLSFIVTSLRP